MAGSKQRSTLTVFVFDMVLGASTAGAFQLLVQSLTEVADSGDDWGGYLICPVRRIQWS